MERGSGLVLSEFSSLKYAWRTKISVPLVVNVNGLSLPSVANDVYSSFLMTDVGLKSKLSAKWIDKLIMIAFLELFAINNLLGVFKAPHIA